MRSTFVTIFAFAFVGMFAVRPAHAQRRAARVPDAGMWAAGAEVGAAGPREPSLDTGLEIDGKVEGYATPRVSLRVMVGTAWWDVVGRGFTGSVRPFFIDGNVVYNWEGGAVHPYVTAGVGMYRYYSDLRGVRSAHDTNAGVNLGGGVEYFFTRQATMTFEFLYHAVGEVDLPAASFEKGSFWSFGVGGKAYFGR
jgi:hypothetical protein